MNQESTIWIYDTTLRDGSQGEGISLSLEDKLKIAVRLITGKLDDDDHFPGISESVLQQIVINESDKTYLTKQVDEDNKEGLFRGFKSLCNKIASFIAELNPEFNYPHSLISTALEAAHQQLFFAKHLPSLTDLPNKGEDVYAQNEVFLRQLVFNTIRTK